jgi:surface-anchored protein
MKIVAIVSGCALLAAFQTSATCFHFTNEHVDLLSFVWNAEAQTLSLKASDDTHGMLYASNECVVVCPESMKFSLPSGTPFGNAGDSLWILPQNSYAGVPYVGISAETLSTSDFEDTLRIQLVNMEGPGQFMLWQSSTFGSFDVRMDTRDGIDSQDALTPLVGAHEHYNWGFTTNGIYRLYFQASALQKGTGKRLYSPVTPFTFQIWPLNGFDMWQATNWPCECATNIIAPAADPDGDHVPNLFEYAKGTNPNQIDVSPFFSFGIIHSNGVSFGSVSYSVSKNIDSYKIDVGASSSLGSTNWEWLTNRVIESETDSNIQIRVIDSISITNSSRRFFNMRFLSQ